MVGVEFDAAAGVALGRLAILPVPCFLPAAGVRDGQGVDERHVERIEDHSLAVFCDGIVPGAVLAEVLPALPVGLRRRCDARQVFVGEAEVAGDGLQVVLAEPFVALVLHREQAGDIVLEDAFVVEAHSIPSNPRKNNKPKRIRTAINAMPPRSNPLDVRVSACEGPPVLVSRRLSSLMIS